MQTAMQTTAQQTATFTQSLSVVPAVNSQATVTQGGRPGSVCIEVKLQYNGFMDFLRKLLKASTSKKYELSGIGLEAYSDIDGSRNFEELIDIFAARHKLTFFESRALLAQYYQVMTKRGIIVATLPRRN